MSFNKGYELKKFEAHWEKLCIEYAAAGMTEEAIQKMYDYDRQQFNSERTFVERTQEFTDVLVGRTVANLIMKGDSLTRFTAICNGESLDLHLRGYAPAALRWNIGQQNQTVIAVVNRTFSGNERQHRE